MKFKIIRSKFIEGLKSVQNIVPLKGSSQILQNVLIEALGKEITLTTTDLDISIKTTIECEVIEAGNSTLPVKLLFNLISKAAEGTIEIDIDANDRAVILAGSAKYKLSGLPEKEFPRLAKIEENKKFNLTQQLLNEMLRKTSYASLQDDSRRALKGVLMSFKDSKLTIVATDGRRLALVESELDFPKSSEIDIILPLKAVQELQRSLTSDSVVTIFVQKAFICFSFNNIMIFSKLIDDKYPNYTQVIPTECSEQILIDRQLFINALERASVMTMDEAHSTRLIFDSGRVTVTSTANDIGEAKDEVPIKYAGERIEIIFNPNFVIDCLKSIDDDEIQLHMNNGHSPAVIKCSIPFIYVIMPLRLN